MITTANLFAEKGHQVTLLIVDHTDKTYYPLHPAVSLIHAPLNFGITAQGNAVSRKLRQWRDTRRFRNIIRTLKPAFLICAEYQLAVGAILGGAAGFTRVFSWEHHHFKTQQLNKFWQYLFKKAYRKLDAVICLNKDERSYYLPVAKKVVVIPNFIVPPPGSPSPARTFQLISVTRFNAIKAIDLLMQTAARLLPGMPEVKWKVIGYGEQKEEFLAFIRRQGLTEQLIYQPADQTDLTAEYRSAAVHVMTSRNECFPLVLLEAMSNGLPCIAFDCDTGPRHIIQQDKTGLLVPREEVEAMVKAIRDLLNNPEKQKMMSANSLAAVQSFFPGEVYKEWEALFNTYQ